VEHLPSFEYDHGLVACEDGWSDETEHNYPTGWPYSHWYVCAGLRTYGFHDEATRIAMKWLRLISDEFARSRAIRERHNVVDPSVPAPGRYPPQRGFGWTNSVFVALLVRVVFGVETLWDRDQAQLRPCFPQEWVGEKVELTLPDYP
jgi:alpha,alpha-trehalase